jgi:FkbM family methyltransferase
MVPTERSEGEWARDIVSQRQYPVVIELGACHGEDTRGIYGACRPAPGLYLAVEADPRNLDALHKLASGRPFLEVVHAAISDHNGTALLYKADGDWKTGRGTGSSSIRRPTLHLETWPDITFSGSEEVPATTLDALVDARGITEVDLIWCDIQGCERDMIAGGQRTLARTRWLLIEADKLPYYDGAAVRDEMPGLLPGWELVTEWPEDANMLFRNQKDISRVSSLQCAYRKETPG